jgi:hypothetical protein
VYDAECRSDNIKLRASEMYGDYTRGQNCFDEEGVSIPFPQTYDHLQI